MIKIINVGGTCESDDNDAMGRRVYEVHINGKCITAFFHYRKDGLAECLRLASEAVKNHHNNWANALAIKDLAP